MHGSIATQTYGLLAALLLGGTAVEAHDLIVKVPSSGPVTRTTVMYQCDAAPDSVGLSAKPFPVEYINAGANSLAVVLIKGQPIIFASVMSGSGARYAAGFYIWWDTGARGAHLYPNPGNDNDNGIACHSIQKSKGE